MGDGSYDGHGKASASVNDWSNMFTFTKGAPGDLPTVTIFGIDVARFDANLTLDVPSLALLPFVPLMRSGDTEEALERAASALQQECDDQEMDEESRDEVIMILACLASWHLATDRVRAVIGRVFGSAEMLDRAFMRYERLSGIRREIMEGRAEGAQEMALAMLRSRFGSVTPELEQAIANASEAELLALVPYIATETPEQLVARLTGTTPA